jgi:tRNA(Ile)-lysidine synthase
MLPPNCTVIAGFSGGADSTALLHWLCLMREQMRLRIIAVHVNHQLRGEASDADEAFCKSVCADWNIDFFAKRVDLPKTGTEEAGRNARYAAFAAVAHNLSAGTNHRVALAHTLSDRTETLLFQLGRGSALRGMCSIPPVRGDIVRPLINCTREQVEAYCALRQLPYRTDASNASADYTRNALRLGVVPQLKAILPRFEESVRKTFHALEADEQCLAALAADCEQSARLREGGWDIRRLLRAHEAVRVRVLRGIVEEHGVRVDARKIEVLGKMLQTGGEIAVSRDRSIKMNGGVMTIAEKKAVMAHWCTPIIWAAGQKEYVNHVIHLNIIENLHNITKEHLPKCLDYDTIIGDIFVSNRRKGDAMHLCKGAGTKEFKKLCHEHAIPPESRNSLVILRDNLGLVWVQGMGCADRCKITERTKNILQINVTRT